MTMHKVLVPLGRVEVLRASGSLTRMVNALNLRCGDRHLPNGLPFPMMPLESWVAGPKSMYTYTWIKKP
jgi:hypothetical protein